MNDVFYICDGEKCENCFSECKHTTDITHALNFEKWFDGVYMEKEEEPSMKLYKKIIFPVLENFDEYGEFYAEKEYREDTVDEGFDTEEWEEKMRKKYEKDIKDEEYESIEFAEEYVEISDILKGE